MTQQNIFNLTPRAPVAPPTIDLRCCSVDEVLRDARGARFVHADPPWRYERNAGGANPENNGIYNGLSEAEIVSHLDAAYACAAPGARMAVWYTWPKSAEWRAAGMAGARWGAEVTGGAWVKVGHVGVGYHWRGQSEPVALFTRKDSATGRPDEILLNGHVSRSGDHSEKPLAWLRQMVRAWTKPGDLVVDLYAGMAPMAQACMLEGRRYIGAEIDPERHRVALCRLAEVEQVGLFGGGR